ncbi:MAG: acyl carrier protein [Ignavibacteria bacterium]|nr:acyl carrier protein [Ignavibacteria bacterium]
MESRVIDALKYALENEEMDVKLVDEFREYAEWDSLVLLTLIAKLDEEFQVAIEMVEFKNIRTVEDLIKAVESKI